MMCIGDYIKITLHPLRLIAKIHTQTGFTDDEVWRICLHNQSRPADRHFPRENEREIVTAASAIALMGNSRFS